MSSIVTYKSNDTYGSRKVVPSQLNLRLYGLKQKKIEHRLIVGT